MNGPIREAWLQKEINRIKQGGTIRLRCAMATEDRIMAGLCRGDVPEDRAHRGARTCSAECRADQKRLMRWEMSKGHCRYCGHGLPRTRKKKQQIPGPGIDTFIEEGARDERDGDYIS